MRPRLWVQYPSKVQTCSGRESVFVKQNPKLGQLCTFWAHYYHVCKWLVQRLWLKSLANYSSLLFLPQKNAKRLNRESLIRPNTSQQYVIQRRVGPIKNRRRLSQWTSNTEHTRKKSGPSDRESVTESAQRREREKEKISRSKWKPFWESLPHFLCSSVSSAPPLRISRRRSCSASPRTSWTRARGPSGGTIIR
jgi:hypothetical protein